MNARVKELSEEIRKLSADERAVLLEELLIGLQAMESEIEAAWAAMARKRWAAYLDGETGTRSADEVLSPYLDP